MKKLFMTLVLGAMSTASFASNIPATNQLLNDEILEMDNKLFSIAFNQCKIELWKDIVSEDIEF